MDEFKERLLREKCNCSLFYVPNLTNTSIMCGKMHYDCIADLYKKFVLKLDDSLTTSECVPSCWEVAYTTSMSLAPLVKSSFAAEQVGLPSSEVVVLKAFLTKAHFRAHLKSSPSSFIDFICECSFLLLPLFTK